METLEPVERGPALVHCGREETCPRTLDWKDGPHPFRPLPPNPGVLRLHVLWGKRGLSHLVSILHQLIELAVHQDARVGLSPAKARSRKRRTSTRRPYILAGLVQVPAGRVVKQQLP